MGGNGWGQTSSLPSICPISLPRDNSSVQFGEKEPQLFQPCIESSWPRSTSTNKSSLIFHILFIQCARAAQSRLNALQWPPPPKAEETPHKSKDTTPRYRTNPGPVTQPHILSCVFLFTLHKWCPYIDGDSNHVGFHVLVIKFVPGQ